MEQPIAIKIIKSKAHWDRLANHFKIHICDTISIIHNFMVIEGNWESNICEFGNWKHFKLRRRFHFVGSLFVEIVNADKLILLRVYGWVIAQGVNAPELDIYESVCKSIK